LLNRENRRTRNQLIGTPLVTPNRVDESNCRATGRYRSSPSADSVVKVSFRTLDASDRSRDIKPPGLAASVAVLGLSVACIAAPFLWLVATMPNPVTVTRVVVEPWVAATRAVLDARVKECAAQQEAVEKKTAPTTSPECAPFAQIIRPSTTAPDPAVKP
jgi:hypothetical protein